jgi:hypothetical protein
MFDPTNPPQPGDTATWKVPTKELPVYDHLVGAGVRRTERGVRLIIVNAENGTPLAHVELDPVAFAQLVAHGLELLQS